jgi:hypothetical protein
MRSSILFFIIIVMLQTFVSAAEKDIVFIREQFYLAVDDEDALSGLEKHIIKNYSSDTSNYPPVILAYAGGIEALKAKHAFSPFAKFSHLMSSLDILEKAIDMKPVDLEIRFLRFSILDNIPRFFGYNEEITSDKNVVINELLKNNFSSLDRETQKGIITYLIESDNLTEEEKIKLKNQCIVYRDQ